MEFTQHEDRLSAIEAMTPEFQRMYLETFDAAFQARVDAWLGDGTLKGLDDMGRDGKNTIRILFHGEQMLFVAIADGSIVYLLPEEKLTDENQSTHHVSVREHGIAEQILAMQQLVCNEWMEPEHEILF